MSSCGPTGSHAKPKPEKKMLSSPQHIVCIGAGPAGLTAAYFLTEANQKVTVLEADPTYVGGISRTVKFNGFCFDIGGHRFFSKSKKIEDFWFQMLGEDFLKRPRLSRIYYGGKFFQYPLEPMEALIKLGFRESIICLLSYTWKKLKPLSNPTTFEAWTINQFGTRLFRIFFQTYTEKVWGMKCNEISADWAAQRIKGVSPFSAIWSSISRNFWFLPKIKSFITYFYYPRKGPGMMWEEVAKRVEQKDGEILLDSKVFRIERLKGGKYSVHFRNHKGLEEKIECDQIISTMPINGLVQALPADPILEKGKQLKYRDFIIVALMYQGKELFRDNWIYIHDPNVRVGRIQNFRAASPEMVPTTNDQCFGMEYFCHEDSEFWKRKDDDLIELAKKELTTLGFSTHSAEITGYVVRQEKAYPVYDHSYKKVVDSVQQRLKELYPEIHLVGRNGMHKYNNQDHSMMTAMLTVENILNGSQKFNVWNVNQDAEYLEIQSNFSSDHETGLRSVPRRTGAV